MGRSINQFPFYIFFLPIFFILHTVNEYYGLIPFPVAGKLLFFYLLLSGVLLLSGKLIFRSVEKAGWWTISILVVFYFFGAVHDFAKNLEPHFLPTSYKFILPLLFIFFILVTILVKKAKTRSSKTNVFLNTLFGIFVLLEGLLFLLNAATHKEKILSFSRKNEPLNIHISPGKHLAPDIFFIVFDEYASSASLKKYLGFNNGTFDSILQHNGFYIVKDSRSNYNVTPLSVASTFNMDYFNKSFEGEKLTAEMLMRSDKEVEISQVPALLESIGYTIKNFGQFDLRNHPALTAEFYNEYPGNAIHLQTLWGRIQKDIWWNVATRLNPGIQKEIIKKEAGANVKNFDSILKEMETENETPKFVYGHILMPHTPYYFDKYGHPLKAPRFFAYGAERDSLYLNQLIYTNAWIYELLKNINPNGNRPRVIVIEGDHGYRTPGIDSREKEFMNLNSFYFSDRDYSLLNDSVSPVNTFRIIFKKYFHANLPFLKDSTILLN
jgi:hypothetical protein